MRMKSNNSQHTPIEPEILTPENVKNEISLSQNEERQNTSQKKSSSIQLNNSESSTVTLSKNENKKEKEITQVLESQGLGI